MSHPSVTIEARPQSRRRFIALAAGAGAVGIGWKWQSGLKFHRVTSKALGAKVSISLLHPDLAVAETAVAAAFAELEQVEQAMSLYRPESEICRLNRSAELEMPSSRLVEVLRFASVVSDKSSGAFDVTVQPFWSLQGQPADAEMLSRVDWRKLYVTESRVLMEQGMSVTLNGIAQGYAADAAMRVVRAHGIEHVLIDAGEMIGAGQSQRGKPWTVGVKHPRDLTAFAAMTRLDGRALATSGDYETAFSADFSKHHIFDPHTGRSPQELSSVSVAAPDAMTADALSTALFVLGTERGLALLRHFPGTDALMITKDGVQHTSAGFPLVA